jgi:hypothetical protein
MIDSYENDKFEIGKEYWTFYIGLTNKENKISDYTGIFQVRLKAMGKCYMSNQILKEFEILQGGKFSKTLAYNIPAYMNGYGSSYCEFFEDYDTCVAYHDKTIKDYAKKLSVKDREVMYSKLIIKTNIQYNKKESDALKWFENLTEGEKEYVKTITKLHIGK